MAGITRTFPFHTLLTRTKTTPYPSSLCSLDSNLSGLRISNPNRSRLDFSDSSSLAPHSSVAARYGGGGPRTSGPGDLRRSRQKDSDDEQALDMSTISKYRYEQQKKKREQQKKSAANRMDLKELKMGYNIDQHDYSVRLKHARKFLTDGDKVKVIVNLKGRENEFRNKAIELIRRFQNDIGELATEESKNFRDKNIFIILVPNKAVLQKAQDPPKKKEKSTINEVSAGV